MMKPKAGALLLGCAVFNAAAVQAIDFVGAMATVKAVVPLDAQSPRPTPPPVMPAELLRKRDDSVIALVAPDNTCGYVSGLRAAAYTCGGNNVNCVLFSVVNTGGLVGCCDKSDCGFRTACLDLVDVSSSSRCDSRCELDTSIEKCTQTGLPFCNTIAFPGGIIDFFCNSLNTSTLLEAETTFSGGPPRSYAIVSTSSSVSLPTTSRTRTTTAPPTSTTTDTGSSGGGGGGSSTPVGAIVGGVVGGLAVIALLVVALVLILRKKRQPPNVGAPGDQLPPHQMAAANDAPPYGQPSPGVGGGPYSPPPQDPSKLPPFGAGYASPHHSGYYPPGEPGSPVSTMYNTNRDSSVPGSVDNRVSQLSFTAYHPPSQPSPQLPPTIHEAGGNAVGAPRAHNENHHGQMHEMG